MTGAMMTPEDVLLESIAAASLHGDTPRLRERQCQKLREAIVKCGAMFHVERDDGRETA